MMSYYLLRTQASGCDYTIGCGLSFGKLNASTKEEAIEEAMDLGSDWHGQVLEDGEFDEDSFSDWLHDTGLSDVDAGTDISGVWLYEITERTNLVPILRDKLGEVNAWADEQRKLQKQAKKRKQYEALKQEFEDNGE